MGSDPGDGPYRGQTLVMRRTRGQTPDMTRLKVGGLGRPARSPADESTWQMRRGLRQPSDRNSAGPYAALHRAAGLSAHGRGAPPRSSLRSIAAAPSDATATPSP